LRISMLMIGGHGLGARGYRWALGLGLGFTPAPGGRANNSRRPLGRDFRRGLQLALVAPRRGRAFRALAREDLRHLLKHKRSYCPELLTARERGILAKPAAFSRVWMATGKPVYTFITRRLCRWADREGARDRRF